MSAAPWRWVPGILVGLGCLWFIGCGGSASKDPAGAAADPPAAESSTLPTASIAAAASPDDEPDEPDDEDDDADARVELKEGTPEWIVREATRLRLEPPPQTDDLEELRRHRQEKNEKIVKLAQQAIEQTHGIADKERVFNVAVHQLLEARLQQALTGDREQIDALYADVAALHERDAKSAAAAEGAFTLVNFAYTSAKNATGDNAREWTEELARQARHFAGEFPDEERRALPLLYTAARSCELQGMIKEAIECYALLQKNFPASSHAARATPALRRLKLPGNPAQISGPTLDEDQLVLDDLLGKAVLVVFWSSEAKPFVEQLPDLQKILRGPSRTGLAIVGVCLDTDAKAVNRFIVEHKIAWPQIFFEDKLGWDNPIVSYYGVTEIPALWLIDQSGNVVSTTLTVETLAAELDRVISAGSTKDKSATKVSSDGGEEEESILERHPKGKTAPKKSAPADESSEVPKDE